jgi:hypothetical protein
MTALPQKTRAYNSGFTNNARWESFVPRDGDILICTPSKSGTTWMQAICAHLIFGTTKFEAPISSYSPWLDLDRIPIEETLATLEAQTHRRFIKTHTPLDGLPYFENVTYVHVARNPLDVMFSMINHMDNYISDLPGRDDLDDMDALFERWVTTTIEQWAEASGLSIGYLFHHTKSFWKYKELPNIHMFHYTRMRADLPGQMKRLADILKINISEELWPELLAGVSLKNMKAKAEIFAPQSGKPSWKDNAKFFDQGRQGSGEKQLSPGQLALYEATAGQLAEPNLKNWIEGGILDR